MFLTVAFGPRFDEYFCWQVYAILLRSFLLHYSCCSGTLISHGGTAEIGKTPRRFLSCKALKARTFQHLSREPLTILSLGSNDGAVPLDSREGFWWTRVESNIGLG